MSRDRLRELMQEAFDRHREFYAEVRKAPRYDKDGRERAEIVRSRNAFFDAQNRLYYTKLDQLHQGFEEDPVTYVDDVIAFLEIDIPCHRCGYEKEWYLTKLKSLSLRTDQQERLRAAALRLLSAETYRREIRDWARLMIVLANQNFVQEVWQIRALGSRNNADMMLQVLAENRKDLNIGEQE
jgi:hypothetical protein